jgi:hypothetical protein
VRFLLLGKFPPIEGGVSAQTFWLARTLAAQGHTIDVVTNAGEVEPTLGQLHYGADADWLQPPEGGGALRVHRTTPIAPGSFIPFAQPYVSKLFGLSLSVLDKHPCDAILSWYFEPYGLVAALVGQARDIPFIMRHAGSDLGRLASNPELREAYHWALDNAAGVVVTNEREVEARFGPIDRPRIPTARPRLHDIFAARPAPLDVPELIHAAEAWFAAAGIPDELVRQVAHINARPIPPDVLTIGVYGKVGVTKGSFDLVAALADLARAGMPFVFLSLSCGRPQMLRHYYEQIMEVPALAERTRILPPVAPWRVPGFLGGCDVVCFLERNFPIAFHGPVIPREVLSSGACLVCSAEVAGKPFYGGNLVDDRNSVVIPDPTDHRELAARISGLIADRQRTAAIGLQGRALGTFWDEDLLSYDDAVSAFAEGVAAAVMRPSRLRA